jgi:peptidyl-tRNA hydrolase
MDDRVYIVTRADLSVGAQLAQTAHAATEFVATHPEEAATWRATSNSLVVVTAPDEVALVHLIDRAQVMGVRPTVFREADYDDEITAIALPVGRASRRLCGSLPLGGRQHT